MDDGFACVATSPASSRSVVDESATSDRQPDRHPTDQGHRALDEFSVGPNPYTCSDSPGYRPRLRLPRGAWSRDYERCAVDSFDRWGMLEWDADVPAGALLTIEGASADTAAGLDAAPVVVLATVPADAPPVDLEAVFAAAGVPLRRFLRVTVTLEASPDRTSPVFRTIDVQWHCYRMP